MDIKIKYYPEYRNISISSRPLVLLGVEKMPEEVELNNLGELNNFPFEGIVFKGIDMAWLSMNAHNFTHLSPHTLCFHESKLDLTNTSWRCKHLIIGHNNKLVLKETSFSGLEEITFLSLREFKGKFKGPFHSLRKAVLWKCNTRVNEFLRQIPNLRELSIFQGSVEELDLSANVSLEAVDLHLCTKLTAIKLNENYTLPSLVLESCNKMADMSNSVGYFARFPPIKSK